MHTFLCAWVCLNSVLPISLSDLIMMTELMLAESKPLRTLPYSALCPPWYHQHTSPLPFRTTHVLILYSPK